MERKDVVTSPEYWMAKMQLAIYQCVAEYMASHHMSQKELAAKLGLSEGRMSQLLNASYNPSLSKLVEIVVRLGFEPTLLLNSALTETHVAASESEFDNASSCAPIVAESGVSYQ